MNIVKLSRRDFVKISSVATAGLVLGYSANGQRPTANAFDLGTFVQIGTDGIVTVWVTKSEMGQGVRTSLPILVAEELDADLKSVRIRQAHFDRKFGRQGTGGSSSMRTMWKPLRTAGATARAMLVTAAATKLGVDAAQLTVANGVITHGKDKLAFADVAEAASKLEVPKDVKLKDPAAFKLIGKKAIRFDDRNVVTGKAQYGIDVRVPGMLYAAVARSPVFGGKVASFDATKAKATRGVKDVVKIDAVETDLPWNGVAVVADSTWVALQGRNALAITWDEGAHANETTAQLHKRMEGGLASAKTIHNAGDVDAALGSAAKKIEATYEVPYLAHAAMEPMNATVHVKADSAEIWAPTQFPDWAASATASLLKLKPEQIKVNVTLLGGAFGRRANPDPILEAAQISKAVGAPVHVQWTREDDMQHDFYRPASMHRISAGLDANGDVIAWHHRIAAPAISAYYEPASKTPHDSEIEAAEVAHAFPNFRIDFALADSGVPRGWWRSVEHSINGFVFNSMLDELAHAAGRDVIDLHLSLLPKGRRVEKEGNAKDYPLEIDRMRKVIEFVREKSGWGSPLPQHVARGFGAHYSFLSHAAQVAEVSVGKDGTVHVHRIVCAIDCGIPVNPDGIRAQIEGGILYGLTAALGGEITIDKGRVQQSNFHDYPLIRISEVPKIEVHIVPSTALPTGSGEPGLPPTAGAVANAIFAATGKRLRRLPFGDT
ncbi:MAG TPA: xanthine dehydrogenase family protein molybdopterin-binding subunit, partial [Thermoanaerobaculia bacterium]|nr:xanthine dehydrogenase family protein molybdopterin-binding subunit [Thermoanaerobaculia bacterium]